MGLTLFVLSPHNDRQTWVPVGVSCLLEAVKRGSTRNARDDMTNLTRMTFVATALAAVTCAGAAVQKSWTGGDGCVSDPTKWSGGAVPTAGQQAVFSGTGSYTVSYPDGN